MEWRAAERALSRQVRTAGGMWMQGACDPVGAKLLGAASSSCASGLQGAPRRGTIRPAAGLPRLHAPAYTAACMTCPHAQRTNAWRGPHAPAAAPTAHEQAGGAPGCVGTPPQNALDGHSSPQPEGGRPLGRGWEGRADGAWRHPRAACGTSTGTMPQGAPLRPPAPHHGSWQSAQHTAVLRSIGDDVLHQLLARAAQAVLAGAGTGGEGGRSEAGASPSRPAPRLVAAGGWGPGPTESTGPLEAGHVLPATRGGQQRGGFRPASPPHGLQAQQDVPSPLLRYPPAAATLPPITSGVARHNDLLAGGASTGGSHAGAVHASSSGGAGAAVSSSSGGLGSQVADMQQLQRQLQESAENLWLLQSKMQLHQRLQPHQRQEQPLEQQQQRQEQQQRRQEQQQWQEQQQQQQQQQQEPEEPMWQDGAAAKSTSSAPPGGRGRAPAWASLAQAARGLTSLPPEASALLLRLGLGAGLAVPQSANTDSLASAAAVAGTPALVRLGRGGGTDAGSGGPLLPTMPTAPSHSTGQRGSASSSPTPSSGGVQGGAGSAPGTSTASGRMGPGQTVLKRKREDPVRR